MPVEFLTPAQRQRYGRYPDSLSPDELGRHFHLDDDDCEWIASKRRDSSRLGFALQLMTVRFLGTFLEDPVAVPAAVLHTVAAQIDVADLRCVAAYRKSEQRWRHTAEIRERYGYCEFAEGGVQFRLGRWLCAVCWTGTDRPSLLFDHASGWLIGHKVLLPGVSILERFVAEVRSRMESRLWRLLVRDVSDEQRRRLDELLKPVDGSRQSWFDLLRKGPVLVSGPALVQALLRIETVRGLGIKLPAAHVPRSRIAPLARFANTVKVSAVARLPALRRTATLVAFVHSLEASVQGNADARPLLEALQWLRERPGHDPPVTIVDKAWQRHVVRDDDRIDANAFTFCVLDKLRVAIRRGGVAMEGPRLREQRLCRWQAASVWVQRHPDSATGGGEETGAVFPDEVRGVRRSFFARWALHGVCFR